MVEEFRSLSLLEILPESIRGDPQLQAAAQAFDKELQAVTRDIRENLLLSRIDELPEAVVDLLAWQWHVDFYQPVGLDVETKRRLVKQSIAWHRIKGTPAAVEEVLSAAFADAVVKEWFEYGGEPYHFRIKASGFNPDSKKVKDLIQALNTVKNARSWMDDISIDVDPKRLPMNIYYGLGQGKFGRKKIEMPKPEDAKIKPLVGIAHAIFGKLRIPGAKAPPTPLMPIFSGLANIRTGRINIPALESDINIDVTPQSMPMDMLVGLGQAKLGRKKIRISSPEGAEIASSVAVAQAFLGKLRISGTPAPQAAIVPAYWSAANIRRGRITVPCIKEE